MKMFVFCFGEADLYACLLASFEGSVLQYMALSTSTHNELFSVFLSLYLKGREPLPAGWHSLHVLPLGVCPGTSGESGAEPGSHRGTSHLKCHLDLHIKHLSGKVNI